MAWAENPAAPGPVPLQGWATNPSFVTIPAVRGWTIPHFALFSGEGTLSATVFAIAQVAAAFASEGTLAAILKQIYSYPALFTSEGTLAATLTPILPALFASEGTLAATMLANAILLDAEFSSEGTLSAIIGAQIPVDAEFSSEGTLAASVTSQTYPLMGTLTDNFATQDNTKWAYSAGASVVNGQLQMTAAPGAQRQIVSNNFYSLVNSSAAVWAKTPGDQSGAPVGYGTTELRLYNSIDWQNYQERMYQLNGQLVCVEMLGGTNTIVAPGPITYNATAMQFWRIRSDGTTVYWETSPDNTTWTTQRSKVAGAGISLQAMQVAVMVKWANTSVGTVVWDNFNITTPVKFITANFSGAGTLAANVFQPFTEQNVAQTNQPVPAGTSGCWVTLVGAGGGGGGGNTGGGGSGAGGGGGAMVSRTFIPVASLGPTYTVAVGGGGANNGPTKAGGNGGSTSFASGAITLTAGGGLGGPSGGAPGGGGTATAVGITASALTNGGQGAAGISNANGQTGGSAGPAGGGGGSGGGDGTLSSHVGGNGGNGAGSAGAAGAAGNSTGGNGMNMTNQGGGGGGGGGGNGLGTGGTGGFGGTPGGGGGGGGSGSSGGANANWGGAGSSFIEWV